MFNFEAIKLIIWDLDDTFWKGTLSEGPVEAIPENISLLKELTEHGIVNTICSKNDKETAISRLKAMNVEFFFVFSSINWSPKGQRISQQIKDMGLRPTNCLFVDDNVVNLNEAKYYEKDLMVSTPDILIAISKYLKTIPVSDKEGKRLKDYKILEEKQHAKALASDNKAFLYNSNTRVFIHNDCLNHLERIFELVNRTNQLNYTKLRSTKEELELLCKDSSTDTGYVTVQDKYGDYGIVGFYAIKEGICIHFLFSCRTIGQGVEQYVYAFLDYPRLTVEGDVVQNLTTDPAPGWINQEKEEDSIKDTEILHTKVLFKGACDLKVMSEYLQTDKIIEEYTYNSINRGNYIEHHNHSINYLQWSFLSSEARHQLLEECIFNDEAMFDTSLYDKDISIAFLSTMIEPNLGIYRRKSDGFRIAFGERLYPLTDPKNWDLYIDGTIFIANNHFTKEWLEQFSSQYEYAGSLSPEQILENAKILLKKVSPNTKLCYILGSETPFEKNTQPNYEGRHLVYRKINQLFREFSRNNDRVLLIDLNEIIKGQEDFTNNINHFHRRVYYEIAMKANEHIKACTGAKVRSKSKIYLYWKDFIDRIGYTGFYQTKLWAVLRRPYIWIKRTFLH
ncbi:MAG: HAD-IIIC family phosphatase [Prevotella sp.]|nr:HAD-IIIC family phosphatase [Prevotella sp.]